MIVILHPPTVVIIYNTTNRLIVLGFKSGFLQGSTLCRTYCDEQGIQCPSSYEIMLHTRLPSNVEYLFMR